MISLGIQHAVTLRAASDVQVRNADVLEAPSDVLYPVLHELALEKVVAAVAAGELEDELVFA